MIRAAAALAIVLAAASAPKTQPKIGEWNMQTSQLAVNLATGAFSAPMPVTLSRADGSTVQGDRAIGNYKLQQATLYGHVTVHDMSGTFGLESTQTANRTQPHGPATLTAQRLHLDDRTHLYDADGGVHYEQGDTTVDAQTAHLNDATHEVDLNGKVHVVHGDQTMDAQSATYNTQTGAGVAQGNVLATFPGGTLSIATPKPIVIKKPKIP